MAGSISILLNSGVDAFTNLFDVSITFPKSVTPAIENSVFSTRAISFQPPELTLMTNQTMYKAVQLEKLMPKITGERTFTLQFRVDSDYALYDALMAWKHIWVNPSDEGSVQPGSFADNSLLVTADTTNYGAIEVVAYKANTPISGYSDSANSSTVVASRWSFYDVICTKVGSPNFQRSGSDFVTITSEFIFGRMQEPASTITSIGGTPTLN